MKDDNFRLSDPIKGAAGWRLELDIITAEVIFFYLLKNRLSI